MTGLNYGAKETYVVAVGAGARYVFESNALDGAGITAADLTTLGITAFDYTNPGAGAFLAANSPIPYRAKKYDAVNGYTETFCATAQVQAAKQAGFSITQQLDYRPVLLASAGKRQQTVFVEIGGIRRAWNMHNELFTKIQADFQGLGITVATANDTATLVWGSRIPMPATVRKIIPATDGSGFDTVTTFCSQAREDNLPAGWGIVDPHVLFAVTAPTP